MHSNGALISKATKRSTTLHSLKPGQRQQLAQRVYTDYQQWKQARSVLENRWRECWEAYLCDTHASVHYTQASEYDNDRSRVSRPVLYEAVEAIHSNLLNAMFPANEQFFTVLGKTEQDHVNARTLEEFLKSKIDESNFFEKYGLFLKQAVITGNTVAAVPWKRKSVTRKKNVPVTLLGITVDVEKTTVEEVVYNGPDFEVLDIFDFLIDPDATDFNNATVIRKIERHLDDIKNNPCYFNVDDLQARMADLGDNANKRSRRSAFGISEAPLEGSSSREKRVTLLEAWGDFRIGDTVYENHVCVVANGNTVIRFEENPYDHGEKPFIFTTFIPVPNEVYGIGAIEKSLGLQHAINTLTNQKLDVINISINNPFTYLVNDDVFNPDTIVTSPGALIPVKSHDTLKPIQYLNDYTVAFNEIADLKAEIQEATGAFKYFTGSENSPSGQKTATEVSALVSGGSQKFSFFMSHLENTSIELFLRITLENAKQFLNKPETLRIAKQDGSLEFTEVLPEILQQCDCTFKIDGSHGTIVKEQEISAMVSFLEAISADPQIKSKINVLEVYKKIYRRLGFKDESGIFLA